MYIDPSFEVGSSAMLAMYTKKVPPPIGDVTFINTFMHNVPEVYIHPQKKTKKKKSKRRKWQTSYTILK